jgi:predicted flavoprotein YhiN
VRKVAETMVGRFADEASPGQILELAKLAKEAREMERKADVASKAIDARRAQAMEAMRLRERILDAVVARMSKNDDHIDTIIRKLEASDDPAIIAALAEAIAKLSTTDQLSAAGEAMGGVKADDIDVDLEF